MGRSLETGCQASMVWAVVANTVPAAFWLVYYALRLPAARAAVEVECEAVAAAGSSAEALESTPALDSMLSEALRLTSGSIVMREVVGDVAVPLPCAGRTVSLRVGDRVALFPPLTHLDATTFPDPEAFVWDRFLKAPELARRVTAFGGGVSMCPGRFFARREIKAFAAALLHRYELELEEPAAARPDFAPGRSGLGIYGPACDLQVRIRPRAD